MKTLREQLAAVEAQRDHCLRGGERQAHQGGEDLMWLMGWADNAIEADLIREKLKDDSTWNDEATSTF